MQHASAVAMNLAGVRNPDIDGPQGDAIPFFHDGRYHLYYLEAPAGKLDQPDRGRTPWRHLVSENLVDWQDLGIVLPLGEGGDPDIDGIWTGSIIVVDGVVNIFYTGGRRSDRTPQTVCHASSTDGVTFVKTTANPIHLPQEDWFERQDWRDPFVFWNDAHKQYWMLISARLHDGPPGRRGVIALSTSNDLMTWTTRREPFYAPGNTYCMECPEIFELGGKWRMIFSRFSEQAATIYREADSVEGPWRTPAHPALDGVRWYAAKSLEDDRGRRIAFGWAHDRRGFEEGGEWLWGGDMCLPREIYVSEDDRLCVRLPEELDAVFGEDAELQAEPVWGDWDENCRSTEARGSFAAAGIGLPELPDALSRLTIEMTLNDIRGGVGLSLYSNAGLDGGLTLFFDAASGNLSLGNVIAGKEADRMPEPLVTNKVAARANGPLRFDVYFRGNTLEIFVDRQVALTHRHYFSERPNPHLFVEDGCLAFSASIAGLRPDLSQNAA